VPSQLAAPAPARKDIVLPDRISSSELKRLMKDIPGSFDLVDIRPPAQFTDYNLPGSKNVGVADLVSDPAFLTGAKPLIIVDRDGSLAMAVGGVLAQKTQRSVKVLYGGLGAYWADSDLGGLSGAGGAAGTPGAPAGKGAPPPPQTEAPEAKPPLSASPPPTPPPQPPKKKSAGC
jgi:rhodanese-related sulfurtransferase